MTQNKFTLREQDGNFIFEIVVPKTELRFNPYMEGESERGELGSYTTVTGLIDKRMSEYGFSFTIDMDYKGKDDQCTSIFLAADPFMEREEFESLCMQHNIPIMIETTGVGSL